MPRGKTFSSEEIGKIEAYRECGWSIRAIAKKLKRSHFGVANVIKLGENYGKKIRSGRPPIITARQKREIIREASSNKLSASEIRRKLELNVSTRRVRQILHESDNFIWKKSKGKPALKQRHKNARLEFALSHLSWTDQWRKVIFSDEKKFTLDGPDGYQRYWHDKRNNETVSLHRNFKGGNLMVWAGFCYKSKTPICFITNKMNGTGYIDLLDNVLLTYLDEFDEPDVIFQQDNAPIHTAGLVLDWFKEKNIDIMKWPALSPDLNPIENIWGIMSNRIYSNGRQYESLQQLKCEINRTWAEISKSELENLINSMPKRMEEVVRNSGAHTHY